MTTKQRKSIDSVRMFNETFKVGQKVKYEGVEYKTWAPCGLNTHDEPAVFLDSKNLVEPVPITQLQIDGWELVYGKRAQKKRD